MISPAHSLLARRLRRLAKDTKNRFALGEALDLLADIIIDVGQKFREVEDIDTAEKGRFAMLTFDLHGAVKEIAAQFIESSAQEGSPPPAAAPKKLHLSHLT